MVKKEREQNKDWRDVLLAKLDDHCTRFNQACNRVGAVVQEKGNQVFPYFAAVAVGLNLAIVVIGPLFRAILRNQPLHAYLNRHDWLAYACLGVVYGILPLAFVGAALYLTYRIRRRHEKLSLDTCRRLFRRESR